MKNIIKEWFPVILAAIGIFLAFSGAAFYEHKMNQQMMECRSHYSFEDCTKLITR